MTQPNLIEAAKSKINEKDFDGALVLLNKILDASPQHDEALYERGVLFTNQKKLDLALFDFNKLIETAPSNPFYYSCRAFIKTGLKDTDGAIKDYQYAIKLDPDDAITHNNLGLLQEQSGYQLQAEKSYERSNEVIGYNPNRYDEGTVKSVETSAGPINDIDEMSTKSKVIKSVFTKKTSFKEFLAFIKNGFKIKGNDQD